MTTLKPLVFSVAMFMAGASQAGFMMGPPPEAKEAVYQTIIENVDASTAANLETQKSTVTGLKEQFKTLMEAEQRDEAAIANIKEQLKSARKELRESIRGAVDGNDELKDTIKAQVRDARQDRRAHRFSMRNPEAFDSVVNAADASQAETLKGNREKMRGIMDEMKAAREAGATREEMRGLREQIHSLKDEQKEIVSNVLENNTELKEQLINQAQENRPERPMRPNRPNRSEMK